MGKGVTREEGSSLEPAPMVVLLIRGYKVVQLPPPHPVLSVEGENKAGGLQAGLCVAGSPLASPS